MKAPLSILSALLLFNSLSAQTFRLDSTFGNAGVVISPSPNSSEIKDIAAQPDGRIVAAGYEDNMGEYHFRIARYNSNGTLDPAFGTGGIVKTNIGSSDMAYSVALQADGKIIVGGNYLVSVSPPFEYHSTLVRYNTDGSLDNTFGSTGIVKTAIHSAEDGIASIALQDDGKIVAGGYAGNKILLMRYNTDGTLDNTFGSGGVTLTAIGSEASAYKLKIQPDGKIVLAGTSGTNGNYTFSLVRYISDGTLDTSFGSGGITLTDFDSSAYDIGHCIALDTDGKVIVAGFSGSSLAMARYDSDGTLDAGFASGGKFTSTDLPGATGLVIQRDGKYIVAGNVMTNDYGWDITRLTPGGIVDTTFGNMGTVLLNLQTGNDYVQCMTLLPNDKIVAAGSSRESSTQPASFTLIRFFFDINSVPELYRGINASFIPNPFSDRVTLLTSPSLLNNGVLTLQLFNMLGEEIMQHVITHPEMPFDLSFFPKGLYSFQVLNEGQRVASGKIIKQ